MSGIHPVIGSKIWMETISGLCVYSVVSKKNIREMDFHYSLLNGNKKQTYFDLKAMSWGYTDEGTHDETFLASS